MRPRATPGRAMRRHLRRHPWQLALAVLGVALGVAVVVAIDLANASARRAFTLSAQTIAGRATHQVVGGPEGLPDGVYRRLRVDAGVRPAAPIVEGDVALPAAGGRAFRLLGVDPFAEAPFRGYLAPAAAAGSGSIAAFLTVPGAALLPAAAARELGLVPGDDVAIRTPAGVRTLRVIGTIRPRGELARVGLADVVVTDVATAQELLGRVGRIDRVDLMVPDGDAGAALLRRARAVLPPGAAVVDAGARAAALGDMTRAFSLNLTALSLLALIFGMFLIYDSTSFAVVQRRALIGTLRALGVTRGELFRLIASEALAVGVAGTALGLVLGVALASGLVRLVARTINDLYFAVTVRRVDLDPGVLALGAALGVLATMLASLPAALEATQAPPRATLTRSVLEARFRRAVPRVAAAGAALAAAGVALLALPGRGVGIAFAALFALVIGAALLVPAATLLLMAVLRPPLRRAIGPVGAMAARGVATTLSRTAPAIAALSIAVSVTVALGVMIGSFRHTVERWLDTTLRADVYVSAPSAVASRTAGVLDATLVRRVVATPGVAAVSTNRSVRVESPAGPLRLVALGLPPRMERAFDFARGDPRRVWPAFRTAGAVIVSESFAYRRRLRPGDTLRLRTDAGPRAFPIAGIFYDYGSDQGVVMIDRATYRRYWNDRDVTALGLFAAPGVPLDTLLARVRARTGGTTRTAADAGALAARVTSNRALRDASLRVFDRTFAITAVLRGLAFIVAFIGVAGALMALQLERVRELGVLRATGLTRLQVWHLVTTETGLMGLAAGLFALPLGLMMALVMVRVVNRRSFGWTLHLHVQPAVMVQALALALVAALLAGLYPAWRMAAVSPAAALREE